MNKKQEFLNRVYVVLGLFVVATLVLFYKAFVVSVVEGDQWREKSKELYYSLFPVEAERGKILSDDGSPLATSLTFFEVRMDTRAEGLTKEVFMKNIEALAEKLSKTFIPHMSKHEIKRWLIRERENKNRYVAIAKDLNFNQLEEIKKFPIFSLGANKGGFIVIQKNRREKPYKRLASRTIGLHRVNAPSVGLESSFNQVLKGEEGKRLMKKVGPDIYLPVENVAELAAKKGSDIVTTLNVSIQETAQSALEEAILKHEAEEGCVVVMEVKTGAIKAISNLSFNDEGVLDEVYNFAIGKSTEPGSTFKLASVMALLDEGSVDLNTPVNLNGGTFSFYDRQMNDSKLHGIQVSDLQHAFEQSSNVGISRLCFQVFGQPERQQKFVEYLKKFKLDIKTNVELEGEPAPAIKDPLKNKQQWYGTTLPWMSVGYELQLTPLQVLNLYNSVANGGRVMKPFLVAKVVNGDKVIDSFDPVVLADSIVSPATVSKVQQLLKGVIENGTARIIKSDLYSIAGKTGTAVSNYYKTGESRSYQSSFAGYFPADKPLFSCIVVIYNPKKGYYGAEVAAPVFKKIADRCMRDYFADNNIVNLEPKVILTGELLPVGNAGNARDFSVLFHYIGLPFLSDLKNPWIKTMNGQRGIFSEGIEFETHLVPTVLGMGLRDAVFLLEPLGLEVVPRGAGRIVHQSIPPGSHARNTKIELIME